MKTLELITNTKNLSNSEEILLKFINKNPKFFINHKITEISKQANISNSTVTRLVKKLGFKYLKELQIDIANKLNYITTNSFNTSSPSALELLVNNLKIYYTFSIQQTLADINEKMIQELTQVIFDAPQILVYGVGSSFHAASELAHNLHKIGYNITCQSDFHKILLNFSKLNTRDLIILISKSGETKEILYILNEAFGKKIPVCLISANEQFKFSRKVKYFLKTATHEQNIRLSAIPSRITQLLLVDLLFLSVFNFNKEKNLDYILQGNEIIKNWNK